MSVNSAKEPWRVAARKGRLVRKNQKHGYFENPWQDMYQCWIADNQFKLRGVETVTIRSALTREPTEQVAMPALRAEPNAHQLHCSLGRLEDRLAGLTRFGGTPYPSPLTASLTPHASPLTPHPSPIAPLSTPLTPQPTVGQVVVSEVEERLELSEWDVSLSAKDRKADKFTLVHTRDGQHPSFSIFENAESQRAS